MEGEEILKLKFRDLKKKKKKPLFGYLALQKSIVSSC